MLISNAFLGHGSVNFRMRFSLSFQLARNLLTNKNLVLKNLYTIFIYMLCILGGGDKGASGPIRTFVLAGDVDRSVPELNKLS